MLSRMISNIVRTSKYRPSECQRERARVICVDVFERELHVLIPFRHKPITSNWRCRLPTASIFLCEASFIYCPLTLFLKKYREILNRHSDLRCENVP